MVLLLDLGTCWSHRQGLLGQIRILHHAEIYCHQPSRTRSQGRELELANSSSLTRKIDLSLVIRRLSETLWSNAIYLKGELSSNIPTLIAPDDPWYIKVSKTFNFNSFGTLMDWSSVFFRTFKASARLSFDKTFDSLSPINNKITGARVKPVGSVDHEYLNE